MFNGVKVPDHKGSGTSLLHVLKHDVGYISQLAYAIPPSPWVRRLHVGFSRSEGFTDGGAQAFPPVLGEYRLAVARSGSELNLKMAQNGMGAAKTKKPAGAQLKSLINGHILGGVKNLKNQARLS